jgi:hypothetical protein
MDKDVDRLRCVYELHFSFFSSRYVASCFSLIFVFICKKPIRIVQRGWPRGLLIFFDDVTQGLWEGR